MKKLHIRVSVLCHVRVSAYLYPVVSVPRIRAAWFSTGSSQFCLSQSWIYSMKMWKRNTTHNISFYFCFQIWTVFLFLCSSLLSAAGNGYRFGFQKPEGWNTDEEYRSLGYLWKLAIWAMQWAVSKPKLHNHNHLELKLEASNDRARRICKSRTPSKIVRKRGN